METLAEIAAEPPAEPQPELAEAVAEVIAEEAEEQEEEEEAAVEIEEAETVTPVVLPPVLGETDEPSGIRKSESRLRKMAPKTLPEDGGEDFAEAVTEEEGPEPARIPTSLTATLREQGARYPHRVSRRSRRRGRDGRGPAPEPGQQRPPVQETRQVEGRAERTENVPAPAERPERGPRPERAERTEARTVPSISDLLKEGQEIIVQIAKEPLGQKGARITSHIALPGRFLVYMPTVDHIGVSRKIPCDEERSASEARAANASHRHSRRLHRAHRRRWPHRRRTARRHDVPLQPLARHAPEGRAQAGARC